jgi:hypothetical protein
VATSLRTAIHNFSGYVRATFAPLERTPVRWSAWPADPNSYTPNWRVYEVAFALPGDRRVTVLWNGDALPLRIRIPRLGQAARLLDMQNEAVDGLISTGKDWTIEMPPATAHYEGDPVGYYFIGGEPRLLLEDAVAPDAPVVPPRPG